MPDQTTNTETTSLSLAERKIIFLMREMNEYEKIEVRRTPEGISIVSTSTTKETFKD